MPTIFGERFLYQASTKSLKLFVRFMEKFKYSLFLTAFYYGSIWIKIGTI
jgi:hypothetical protein